MLRTVRHLPVVAAIIALPGVTVLHAQTPAAGPAATAAASPAPAAKELMARYVAAIGGRDALLGHASMRSTGTFELPAAGLKGDLVIVQARDGRTTMRIDVGGLGSITGGYDGTVGWSMNPMQGPRVLDGKELAQMREDAGFLTMLRESPAMKSAETVGRSEIGGVACWKVKLVYESGRTSFDCYSIDTGLLAGTTSVQESAMGTVEVVTVMADWKEFGGLRIPTTMRQAAMGQEQVLTITDVKFDGADDAASFALPEPIKALAAQRKP